MFKEKELEQKELSSLKIHGENDMVKLKAMKIKNNFQASSFTNQWRKSKW